MYDHSLIRHQKFGLTKSKCANMRNDTITAPATAMCQAVREHNSSHRGYVYTFAAGDERLGLGRVGVGARAEHLACTTDEI